MNYWLIVGLALDQDTIEGVRDIALRTARVVALLETDAHQDKVHSDRSLRFSLLGIGFLMAGFGLQIVGVCTP